jgi:SAM-dependent methyltransferase
VYGSTAEAMEALNRRAWSAFEVLRWYRRFEGNLDAGERICFERLQAELRDQPLLDLGVGGGRTTRLLLPLTTDYVGLDYTIQMVRICRRKFPGVRIEHGDARDLSRFGDRSFQTVVFSFNGLDLVHDEGRDRILREAYRVLRPGGTFYFSTINRDGPDFRGPRRAERTFVPTLNPLKLAVRAARWTVGRVRGRVHLARYSRFEEHREGHSILLHQAYDFGMLVYATSLAELRAQLHRTGFAPEVAIVGAKSGAQVLNGHAADESYLHVLARKLPAK